MRSALLAASLLAATPAFAAQPQGGHYVWVPAGASVVLVPNAQAQPIDFPVARMIVQQEAMMNRMLADMNSLVARMPLPDPSQMMESVMQGVPQVAPGSSVVVTSISTGNGTCSQTITYSYPGNGGQPVVKTSSAGNACGELHSSAPVQAVQPAPGPTPRQRLWTIGYPPHLMRTGVPPRS
jgi:hypothetical protein